MTRAPGMLRLTTAGQQVIVHDAAGSVHQALHAATGWTPTERPFENGDADLVLTVEPGRARPATEGFWPVTRGVWVDRNQNTLFESTGGSGYAQLWSVEDDVLHVRSWWAPSGMEAAAAAALRPRFRALQAQVLLHYPALWWATQRGLAPLHVSVVEVDGVVVLLAGPGGVGKSTLVARELDSGASATCDNLATCDGVTAYGLREPLRLSQDQGPDGGHAPARMSGARTTHGRRETTWCGRVAQLRPDVVVVLERGPDRLHRVRSVPPAEAARALVAGTMVAGELRRFWPLTAALAMSMGRGPAIPPVQAVADRLVDRLPCFRLTLGSPGVPLRSLLGPQLGQLRREGVRR